MGRGEELLFLYLLLFDVFGRTCDVRSRRSRQFLIELSPFVVVLGLAHTRTSDVQPEEDQSSPDVHGDCSEPI